MSHIVTIETQVRDPAAMNTACQRLGLPQPVQGTFPLFSAFATGLAVTLPGWRFPVVCDTASGQLQYDNYGGQWGEQQHLHRFLQVYVVEKARLEARKQGYSVLEQSLPNGAIRLTIQTGGGAA